MRNITLQPELQGEMEKHFSNAEKGSRPLGVRYIYA